MNLFCKFIRWRRQSNAAKLAVVMLLVAGYFFANGIIQIVKYAGAINTPCEYLLAADNAVTQNDMNELMKLDGVLAASPKRVFAIVLDGEKTLSVTELSSDYLFTRYELYTKSGCFYMNYKAFQEITGEDIKDTIRLSYTDESAKRSSSEFDFEPTLPNNEPLILSVGTSATLFKDNTSVLVLMKRRDLTGSDTNRIERLGYSVQNREDIASAAHEQELLLVELKYGFITLLLSVFSCIAFIKMSTNKTMK